MYTMTLTELIEELSAWHESASDPATAEVLDNAIDRLERQHWYTIDTVPVQQKILLWSPQHGCASLQLAGNMSVEEVRQCGFTHWRHLPEGPEEADR